jgi:flagellar basal body-associated protein FliL
MVLNTNKAFLKRKIILEIIAIIAVVAIVGGFIFFAAKFKKQQKNVSLPQNMSQPTTGPEAVKPPTYLPPGQATTSQLDNLNNKK